MWQALTCALWWCRSLCNTALSSSSRQLPAFSVIISTSSSKVLHFYTIITYPTSIWKWPTLLSTQMHGNYTSLTTTAPEVGKGNYSPICADHWVVGELCQRAFIYFEQLCKLGHLDEMARLLHQDLSQWPGLQGLVTICRADEHHDAFHSRDSMWTTTPFLQLTTVMVAY